MKMQEKYKQLLEALLESSKEFLNSQELGELAGISQRTVIRYMKELKEQSLKYGFFIHTVKGRGYRLEIIEEEKFRDALAVEEDVEVTKVLFKLFFERTCKLDDLAELLHYSRSGMSRIIEKVEKKLEREGLRLLNKPYVGFFIGGSEVYIRNYLYKLLKKKSLEETEKIFRVPREMLAKVRSEIDAELAQKSVHKRKENELFFLKYLLIQKQRIAIGKTIKTDYFANISQTVHLNHDMEVVRNIQKRIETSVCPKSDEEIENIYLGMIMLLSFVINIILARITPFKYIFLTGHMMFSFAGTMAIVLDQMGINGWMAVAIGSVVQGICMVVFPAIAQPYTRKILKTDEVAFGFWGSSLIVFSGFVGRLVRKKNRDEETDTWEKVKVSNKLDFLKDMSILMSIVMIVVYIFTALMAGTEVVSELAGGQNIIVYLLFRQ